MWAWLPSGAGSEVGVRLATWPLVSGGTAGSGQTPTLVFSVFHCVWADEKAAGMTGARFFTVLL